MTAGEPLPLPALLADVLGIAEGRVTEDGGRDLLPEWTSLAHVQIINAVEEAYGVTLTSREIEEATSVASLRFILNGRGVPL